MSVSEEEGECNYFKLWNIQNIWKSIIFSDFDHDMFVGARQGGLSISESADLLGFVWANRKVTVTLAAILSKVWLFAWLYNYKILTFILFLLSVYSYDG